MTLPAGFSVELVASEPDIVNPVAMTFDERGRIWITESLEYPRLEPGPGRDRIRVLEDTDGDGKADKFTVFAEGLNIPSGIAVGHGGVWVANAPDILYLQDTDGDGKADKQEVVVTGFGRDDTHELPNSLTWGPDGWLYGLNGVFNRSSIKQGEKQFDFTCALFRIHPRTREFQVFAQGTSNPWGVAWDDQGSAFVSACVIDHLWHLAESAYYIRQGGPYPPFTSPMHSIVKHKHQKAAYCGIHYFDSDAYPPQYRQRLYMGNIHGNGINVDVLARDGSTYTGEAAADFLSANDAWFMPVVQKTGPDGCLYILDWYDRYHCYQDARRDPEGIDRLKGRLYRVRYQNTPHAKKFDLAKESSGQLLDRLRSPNVYFRDIAQRILSERNDSETRPQLERLVSDDAEPRHARMHALWSLLGGDPLDKSFHQSLLDSADPILRAWGVRAAGDSKPLDPTVRAKVRSMTADPASEVRLQVAIAAGKSDGFDTVPMLLEVLTKSGDDKLIPHIVWQNLHPLLEEHGEEYLTLISREPLASLPAIGAQMPRVIDRMLAAKGSNSIGPLVKMLFGASTMHPQSLIKCIEALAARIENHEISDDDLVRVRAQIDNVVNTILSGSSSDPFYTPAALLAATWKDPRGLAAARTVFVSAQEPLERRLKALRALISVNDESLESSIGQLLANATSQQELAMTALNNLSDLDAAWVAQTVLANYARFDTPLRAPAIDLLTTRQIWFEQLLESIGKGDIPASALNANQVRNLLVKADQSLVEKIHKHWGTMRDTRDQNREEVISRMRSFLRRTSGDPVAGKVVFQRVCGQCHKLHGEGQDVGPDITLNGRNSFDQLLSNVFDPSLVIGASYQARTVVTADGRVLTGLLTEESDQHVVLKMQGGKLETIARQDVEAVKISALSLMPEDVEKQLKPGELADLFALLTLDKPPADPAAKQVAGSQPPAVVETSKSNLFPQIVGEVAPGFSTSQVGTPGLAIVAEHAGQPYVLRTRPINTDKPCVLRRVLEVPKDRRARLNLNVSHEAKGSWKLVVVANGKPLHESLVGGAEATAGWQAVSLDLSSFAGQSVQLELSNAAADDKPSAGYWGQVEVVFE